MEDWSLPSPDKKHVDLESPFDHKSLKKSLETIVSQAKANTHKQTLDNMISDKVKNLKSTVLALLEEIDLRKNLNLSNLKKLNKEIRYQNTQMMQLENIVDHHPFDLTKELDEKRARIESNVLELEKEKRSEGIECWRDLMFLKKYLMRSLKDYWELSRRREVLQR